MPDSYNMTEQYLLIAVVLAGLIAVPILLVLTVVVVVRRLLRRRPARGTALRAAALLAACVAVANYAWGALHLTADESAAIARCQASVPDAYVSGRLTYDVSFVPLRAQCRVPGVGAFDPRRTWADGDLGELPGYVNPTVAVATCLALALFIAIRRFPDGDSSDQKAPAHVTGQKG